MAVGTKSREIRKKINERKKLKLKDTYKEPFMSWMSKPNKLTYDKNKKTWSYLVFTDEKKLKEGKEGKKLVSEVNYRDKLFYKKGVPTGGISVTLKQEKGGKVAEIDSFYPFSRLGIEKLPPKQIRGRGAGAKLLNDLTNDLKKEGVKKVYVRSKEEAVGFYEKMGFKLIDKKKRILVKEI